MTKQKRRSKSFAKLVLLLFAVFAVGYLALAGAKQAFHEHFERSPTPRCNGGHRFQQADIYPAELRGDLALDTCTGQLCKTWNWTAHSAVGAAHVPYEGIPLCRILANPGSKGETAEKP
jgi:hypothetical protein